MKITDLALDDLKFEELINRYNLICEEEDTIADAIYRFLFSDDSVVNLEGSYAVSDEIKRFYYTKLKKQISKGAPIDFFLTTFSPKFKKTEISNGWYQPDIADLMTIIHLQIIAKTIREIYPYNFRFIIAYKGDLYQRVGGWTKEELDSTYKILQDLIYIAEKITGTRNSIVLTRWIDMFGENLFVFEDRWDSKAEHYYRLWSDKKEPYFKQIERWKKDIFPYMDIENDYKDLLDFFLTKEGCRVRAFNNLIFREGQALDLLQKQNPNLLIAHTRKKSKFFSIVLNPYFQNRTHLKLAVLDKDWGMKTWEEIKNGNYKPIFLDDYDFPFYFENKKTK